MTHIFLFLVLDRTYVWMVGTGFGIAAMLLFARGGNFILSGVVNSLQLPDLDFGTRELFVLFVICDEESGGEEGYIVRRVRSRA